MTKTVTVDKVSNRTQSPEFSLRNLSISADNVTVGEAISIEATVENSGNSSGSHTVDLIIDGQKTESKTVQVDADRDKTLSFSHTFDQIGNYTVEVDGTVVDTVEVTSMSTTAPDDTEASQASTNSSMDSESQSGQDQQNSVGGSQESDSTVNDQNSTDASGERGTSDPASSPEVVITAVLMVRLRYFSDSSDSEDRSSWAGINFPSR